MERLVIGTKKHTIDVRMTRNLSDGNGLSTGWSIVIIRNRTGGLAVAKKCKDTSNSPVYFRQKRHLYKNDTAVLVWYAASVRVCTLCIRYAAVYVCVCVCVFAHRTLR